MLFSSISFLYYFLPIVIVLYGLIPENHGNNTYKNAVLLAASFFFYAWGEPRFCILLAYAVFVGFFGGIVIAYGSRHFSLLIRRILLCFFLVLILGSLILFKYADFFLSGFGSLTGMPVTLLKLSLPIGISFYSFQIISYLADVYMGRYAPERSFLSFATYISFFPQLIAGPIVRYSDVSETLHHRNQSKAADGICRFLTGLAKKVLLADSFGACVTALGGDSLSAAMPDTAALWGIAFAYTLQIYFDFAGYSDMAIGLGRMFGFSFPENFDYPYISQSITEFWRRWHMTLGGWFRDYVYIPLGGNRVSFPRFIINVAIVWFLSGLWHGASWNFVLWGLFYAVFLILEKVWLHKILKRIPEFFRHLYTLFIVVLGFVLFRTDNLQLVWISLREMFCPDGLLCSQETLYEIRSYLGLFIIGIIGMTPVPKRCAQYLFKKLDLAAPQCRWFFISNSALVKVLWSVLLLLVLTSFLVSGSFQAFLYFRF